MPSVSLPQHRLMEASAHGIPWATKKVPQKVGREFVNADHGRKFWQGGMTGIAGRRRLATGGVGAPIVTPLPSGDISPIAASDTISSTNMYPGIATGLAASEVPQVGTGTGGPMSTGNIVGTVPVGGSTGTPNSPYMTSLPLSALTGQVPTTLPGGTPPASVTTPPATGNTGSAVVGGSLGNSPFQATVPQSGAFTATGPNNSVIQFTAQNPTLPSISGMGPNNQSVTIQNPFYVPGSGTTTNAKTGGRIPRAMGGTLNIQDLLGDLGSLGGTQTPALFNTLFGGKGNFFDQMFGIGGGNSTSTTTGGGSSGGGGSTLSTLGDIASIASFFFNRGGVAGKAAGGGIAGRQGFDMGGIPSSSEMAPWSTRDEADLSAPHFGGLLKGSGAGRTDILNRDVPSGSYVVPADVVSGLAEGNTMAGSAVIDRMMHTGPYGTKIPRGESRGPRIPEAHVPFQRERNPSAKGGAQEAGKELVPTVMAAGEHVIMPWDIERKFGDLKRGHDILDAWVLHERKKHIKTLKKLPGPKQ